jgi:hypothetical protein
VSDDDTLAATRRLICAYEDALIGVERMPAVAWLHWSDGPVGKHVRVPHVRTFVRQFLVVHAHRVVAALVHRHHARIATGLGDAGDAAAIDLLEHYDSSLARRAAPLRRFLLAFVAAGLLIAAVVMPLALPASGAQKVLSDGVKAVVADQSPGELYDAALRDPTATIMAFLVTSTLTLALLVVPFASFRYKRWLLAAAGEYGERSNLPMTSGTYALERELQERAGAARPLREVPFDLICLALALSLLFPLWLMLGFLAQDRLPQSIGVVFAGALLPPLALATCAVWAPLQAVRVYDRWLERLGQPTIASRVRARVGRRAPALLREPPAAATVPAPAGRARRLAAAWIDGYAVLILDYGLTAAAVGVFGLSDSTAGFVVLAALPVAGAIYGRLFGARSPGKRALGLEVVWIGGRSRGIAARETAKWVVYGVLSAFTLGLPLLIGLLRTRDGRLFHDRFVGTSVVRAGSEARTQPPSPPPAVRVVA